VRGGTGGNIVAVDGVERRRQGGASVTRRESADGSGRPDVVARAVWRRIWPDLGLLRRLLVLGGAAGGLEGGAAPRAGRRASRAAIRENEHRVLAEWAVMRDRLTDLARERVADVGDLLTDARLEFTPAAAQNAVRRDYDWAMEAFQAAGKLLDEAADLPDLAAAVVLADRAVERFAAAHARHEGRRPAPYAVRCFYNPLHGPAEAHHAPAGGPHGGRRRRRPVSAREAAADRRPACASCRLAILAGQTPDVLPALLPVRISRRHTAHVLVPYYAVPQQASIWSTTGCASYDDTAPSRVLRGDHRRGLSLSP
jgi:hypothetical protein